MKLRKVKMASTTAVKAIALIISIFFGSLLFADIHIGNKDILPRDTKFYEVVKVEIFDSIPYDSAYYIDVTWGYTRIPKTSFREKADEWITVVIMLLLGLLGKIGLFEKLKIFKKK